MGLLLWLLAATVALSLACAATVCLFTLAWDVCNTKYKKQLHGITARYEAAMRSGGAGEFTAAYSSGSCSGSCSQSSSSGTNKYSIGGGGSGSGASGSSPPPSSAPYAAAPTPGGPAPPSVLFESFTLGWLNVLIQHLWLPVLEKLVSNIAAERLQIVLNEVLLKNRGRGVAKYISSVAVEEVTFGLAPPQFQFCTAKYDPVRSYLLLSMNMHFHSSGFQAVFTPRLQLPRMKGFPMRLEVCQLRLVGQLNLGLHLGREPPGVRGVDYWFSSPPEFDIQANPVGYLNLHGELPGLLTALRSLLQRVLVRRVVEPNRRYLDLQRIYRNKYIQRVGGPGGCLRVCLIGGRNLAPPPAPAPTGPRTQAPGAPGAAAPTTLRDNKRLNTGNTTSKGSAGDTSAPTSSSSNCDPYVELRFGREIFRTPIVHRTVDPVFNWQFDVRLPHDIQTGRPDDVAAAVSNTGNNTTGGRPSPSLTSTPSVSSSASSGPVLLHFRVLNARTLGEPEVLSRGVLSVCEMGLEANGGGRPRLLELTGPGGAPQGTLSLEVSWLKAQAKRASPFPQDEPHADVPKMATNAANANAVKPSMAPPPPPSSYYDIRATSTPLRAFPLDRTSHGTVQDSASTASKPTAAVRRKSEVLLTTPFSVETVLSRLHAASGSSPMPHGAAIAAAAAFSEYGSSSSGSAIGGAVDAAAAASYRLQGWCARGVVDSARVALSPVCSLTSVDSRMGCTAALVAAPPPQCHIRHPSTTWPSEVTTGGSTTIADGSTTSTNTSAGPLTASVLHELAVGVGDGDGGGEGDPTIGTTSVGSVITGGRGRGRRSGHGAGKHRRTLAGLLRMGRWRLGGKCNGASGAAHLHPPAVAMVMTAAPDENYEVASDSMGMTEGSSQPSPAAVTTGGDTEEEYGTTAAATATAGVDVGVMTSPTAAAAECTTPPPSPLHDPSPFNAATLASGSAAGSSLETKRGPTDTVTACGCDVSFTSPGGASDGADRSPSLSPLQPLTSPHPYGQHQGLHGQQHVPHPLNDVTRCPTGQQQEEEEEEEEGGPERVAEDDGPPVAATAATGKEGARTGVGGVGNVGPWVRVSAVSSVSGACVTTGVAPAGGGCGGCGLPASLQSLAQVVKMQRLLQAEQQSRSELWGALREVRRKYEAMVRLRRSENTRALMEGARFCVHLGRDVRRVVLWYNEPQGLLQVDSDTGSTPNPTGSSPQAPSTRTAGTASALSSPSASQDLWPRSFPPGAVKRWHRGTASFPHPGAWAGVVALFTGRSRPPPPGSLDPLKCFSLFLEDGRALHLQLPPAGNGRSRDEWLDGLQDLAQSHGASGADRKRHGPPSQISRTASITTRMSETAVATATAVTETEGPSGEPDCSDVPGGATLVDHLVATASLSRHRDHHHQ